MSKLIEEERTFEAAPDDWPIARKLRWRLLHGHVLTTSQVEEEYGGSNTRLIMAVTYLRRNGVIVDPIKRDGVTWYHVNDRPARQPRKAHVNGNGKAAPAGFDRPAPPTPMLGTVLRVVMVAEEDGAPAAVLMDAHGQRWFAHLEQGPAPTS